MAWEWSHTAEAYADAQANLEALPRVDLEIIFAEWIANDPSGDETFNQDAYASAHQEAKSLPASHLADEIWRLASNQATCDNGGFNAWLCPYGCGCHQVPFSRDGGNNDY